MKIYKRKGLVKGADRKTQLKVLEPAELMTFLMENITDKSRNNIKSLLTHRQIMVDGEVVTQYNHLLRKGQEVVVNWSLVRDEDVGKGLNILYEDSEIIVIEKPAGLLTIASDMEKEHTAYHQLTNYVRRTNPENRIFIVHRLG